MANVLNVKILDKFQNVYQALKQLSEEEGINIYVSTFTFLQESPKIKQRITEIETKKNGNKQS